MRPYRPRWKAILFSCTALTLLLAWLPSGGMRASLNTGVPPRYAWHTFYGSSLEDRGTGVAVSRTGPVHIAGYSNGSWQGDGNTSPIHAHSGGFDLLVMQFTYQRSYLPLLQK